jgi:hypothetical protein
VMHPQRGPQPQPRPDRPLTATVAEGRGA